MIYFFLLLVLLAFIGARMAPANAFIEDYLAPGNTRAINGFFVGYVLLRHRMKSGIFGTPSDAALMGFSKFFGQMMGATFLFYSGLESWNPFSARGLPMFRTCPGDTSWIAGSV